MEKRGFMIYEQESYFYFNSNYNILYMLLYRILNAKEQKAKGYNKK